MCEHERLRTVGHKVFCCSCGAELPLEFLLNKTAPAAVKPVKKAAPDEKPDKNAPKKRTGKKAG